MGSRDASHKEMLEREHQDSSRRQTVDCKKSHNSRTSDVCGQKEKPLSRVGRISRRDTEGEGIPRTSMVTQQDNYVLQLQHDKRLRNTGACSQSHTQTFAAMMAAWS
ncbi:unnamed protein product, partial [Ectocarpus sp. 4 AP-2014]